MANWIAGEVLENRHWTEHLFTLKVQAELSNFKPGQFTSLALDLAGERIARPYTFISAPGESPLEFFLYVVPQGKLSGELQALREGDRLWLRAGANGFFTLDEVPAARDLWMLGTGAGIAPYISMLKTGAPWQTFDQVILVQAVRGSRDLLYQQAIDSIRAQWRDRFLHITLLSREQGGDLQGRIPAALADGRLEARAGRDLHIEHSQIMLCGNPGMIAEATGVLKERGFSKNRRRKPGQITSENYW